MANYHGPRIKYVPAFAIIGYVPKGHKMARLEERLWLLRMTTECVLAISEAQEVTVLARGSVKSASSQSREIHDCHCGPKHEKCHAEPVSLQPPFRVEALMAVN
jgi:hypothetical protein